MEERVNYHDSEEFRQILQRYEDLRDRDIDTYLDPDEYADVAEYYHKEGRNEEALEAADKALDIFPGALAPLCFKARYALVMSGDTDTARELAEEIEDKSQMEYIYLCAEIFLAEGKKKEADKLIREYAEDCDDMDEYALDVASIYMDYNRVREAERWLERCTLTNDVEYKELKARIMLHKGQYDECERIFNELIDSNPYSSDYWNQLASSQLMHNNVQDSITSSEFSLAINPNDDQALLNKSNALFTLDNFEEALKYYKLFLERQPENESAVIMIGITLFRLDQYDEAVEYLEKALRMSQEHDNHITYEQTLQELTYVEDLLGNTEGALHYVDMMEEHLKELKSPNEVVIKMAVIPRGYILLEHQRYEEAVKEFQQAFHETDGNPEVVYYICIAVYDTGYYRLAYKLFSVLFLLVDDDWCDGYAYYARCCLLVNDMEEFHKAVKKAVECNPEEARLALETLYPEGTEPEDYPSTPLKTSTNNNDETL